MLKVKRLTDKQCSHLERLFNRMGAKVETWPEHWISGNDYDESLSYCYGCAKKEVATLGDEYTIAGGYRIESDDLPTCEKCERRLEASLTDWGCKDLVDGYLGYGFNPKSPDQCLDMAEVITSTGWSELSISKKDQSAYFNDLHELGRKILEQLKPKKSND